MHAPLRLQTKRHLGRDHPARPTRATRASMESVALVAPGTCSKGHLSMGAPGYDTCRLFWLEHPGVAH